MADNLFSTHQDDLEEDQTSSSNWSLTDTLNAGATESESSVKSDEWNLFDALNEADPDSTPSAVPASEPSTDIPTKSGEWNLNDALEDMYKPKGGFIGAPTKDTSIAGDDQDMIVNGHDFTNLPESDALLYATRLGISDTWRGVKQIFGVDEEYERTQQKVLNALMKHPEYGTKVMAAYFGGAVLDPAGWLIPFGKGGTILRTTFNAAKGGAVAGALGYVDEEQDSLIFDGKMSRGEQALMGTVGGAVLSPLVYGAAKLFHKSKGLNIVKTGQQRLEAVRDLYQNQVGANIHQSISQNAGVGVLGAIGGLAAYNIQDEDPDSGMLSKFGLPLLGFLGGSVGGKLVGKINIKGHNVGDTAARWFIDNYNLPKDFVEWKKLARNEQDHISYQFRVIGEKFEEMSEPDRKLVYNILVGDEANTLDGASELHTLTKESRELITETAQKMVDYGILDETVFKRNLDTYLHRSYLKKDQGTNAQMRRASAAVRMLGDELRVRGRTETIVLNSADPTGAASKQGVERWKELLEDGYEQIGERIRGNDKEIFLRLDYTKPERVAMGEIEDVAYALHETGRLMANDISVYKLYDDVAKSAYTAEASFIKANKITKKNAHEHNLVYVNTERLGDTSIARWGNLAGKYVDADIMADLNSVDLMRRVRSNKYLAGLRKVQQTWKTSKTAWNPAVHMNNIMSNLVLLDLSDTKYKYLHDAAGAITKGNDSELYKLARQHGVLDAGQATHELRNYTNSWHSMQIKAEAMKQHPALHAARMAGEFAALPFKKLTDLYMAEDHFFRLAVFKDRLDKGFDPEDAADEAVKWFIDYNINAPAIQIARETTTPFLAYTYRVVPLLADAAVHRPWKVAKWLTLGYLLNNMGEEGAGVGDPALEKELLQGYRRGNTILGTPKSIRLPFSAEDYEGERHAVRLDVGRWIPGGDVFEEQGNTWGIPFVPGALQPSFGFVGDIGQAIAGYDNFAGRPVDGLGAGTVSDAAIKAKFLAKKLTPNVLGLPGTYSTDKVLRAWREAGGPLQTENPLAFALANTVGIKLNLADLKKMKPARQLEVFQRLDAMKTLGRLAHRRFLNGEITAQDLKERQKEIRSDIRAILKDFRLGIEEAEKEDEER